jgi:hypothetical protein
MIGLLWPFRLISLDENERVVEPSTRETGVFKAVVMPAGASLGFVSSKVISSGWAPMDVNLLDQVKVALAVRVQLTTMVHVVDSTSEAYVGP